MPRAHDLTGQRFGRWTAVRKVASRHNITYWLCRCDCGTVAELATNSFKYGRTKSCGCLRDELSRVRNRRHGASVGGRPSPEYLAWSGAKKRCTNPKSKSYKDYGGRGIVMCDRWLNDFAAFLADMGRKPSPAHSIERIDNDGPYAPDNCRWATQAEQIRNRRSNRLLTLNGRTQTMADWTHELGFRTHLTIRSRLARGWSVERALTTPSEGRG